MLNRRCVADGSPTEAPLSLQGLLHFYGSSILTNSATEAQNTVRTELPPGHHWGGHEHTVMRLDYLNTRICQLCICAYYLIYSRYILHYCSNTTLDQQSTLKLCRRHTFSERKVKFSLSVQGWGKGGLWSCWLWLCPPKHLQSIKQYSLCVCVCPGPPIVPVSASLLSQLILIYGFTLFPAGWLDT